MSALELAWRIVAAENLFLGGVVASEFQFGGPGRIQFSTQPRARGGIRKDSRPTLTGSLAIPYVQFCLNHGIHHRGQFPVYLRPMGAKVPSIYGRSFDDAQARKAPKPDVYRVAPWLRASFTIPANRRASS